VTPEDLEQIRAIVHAEIQAEIKASEERSQEFARDLQTEILSGLQQFARGNFARMHIL